MPCDFLQNCCQFGNSRTQILPETARKENQLNSPLYVSNLDTSSLRHALAIHKALNQSTQFCFDGAYCTVTHQIQSQT